MDETGAYYTKWRKSEKKTPIQYINLYMEFIKMVMMTPHEKQQKRHRCKNSFLDSVGEGKGGMIWENSTETCIFSSVQSLSHVQLCDPMNHSTPGLPVHHQLLEFTQTHVRQVGDAIQPSHPLSSPSPPAPNPSQHQSLFQWVNSSHEVAKVLEFQL